MENSVSHYSINLEIPTQLLDTNNRNDGIVNSSFVGDKNDSVSSSVSNMETGSNDFTEIDLNDSMEHEGEVSTGSQHDDTVTKIEGRSVPCLLSENSDEVSSANSRKMLPGHSGLALESGNTVDKEALCKCGCSYGHDIPTDNKSSKCKLQHCITQQNIYLQDLHTRHQISDGVVLHFCPSKSDRATTAKITSKMDSVYGPALLHTGAMDDLSIYPPPSYRSIIEKTIADAPPAYQAVTGIETNVNEINEDKDMKRTHSSRNWGSLSIPKSRRLIIALILVITLIIGSILVILAVLN